MSDQGSGDRKDRFRRPDWTGPAESEAPREEGEAGLPAVDAGRAGREIGHVLEPLKSLAEAFRENTETLRSIAEGQARMASRLERSDRSEAMIKSTEALNETFRGVQRTQEGLLTRLKVERRRPFLLVPLVAVVLAAILGGALWFLLGWMDRRESTAREGDRDGWQAAVAERAARGDQLAEEIATLKADLVRERRIAEEAERDVGDLRARIQELEELNAGLRADQAGVSNLMRENASLSARVAALEDDLGRKERDRQDLEARLAEKDSELARLRGERDELARRSIGAPPAGPAAASGDPVPSAEAGATGIPAEAARDPAELGRVTSVLNRLLLDTKGSESYSIERIGGIRGRILYEVVMIYRDTAGAEAKRIEAGECRIAVDETQRRAEFRYRNGHIVYYGVRAPFWGGSYVVPVVNIDPAAWLRSGLSIFEAVR